MKFSYGKIRRKLFSWFYLLCDYSSSPWFSMILYLWSAVSVQESLFLPEIVMDSETWWLSPMVNSLITTVISPPNTRDIEKGLKWLQADAKENFSLLNHAGVRRHMLLRIIKNRQKFNSSVRQYSPLTRDSNRIIPSVFRQNIPYASFIVK